MGGASGEVQEGSGGGYRVVVREGVDLGGGGGAA